MSDLTVPPLPDTWSPTPADDQERRLLEVADAALTQARQIGASAAEVSLGHGNGISVNVRNGTVETVEYHRDKHLNVTVYFGHRSGSASTTDFLGDALTACVAAAGRIAQYTEEDPFSGLADPARLARDMPDLDLYHPWDVGMDQAIDMATCCEDAVLSADSRIHNSEGGGFSSYHGAHLYANSLGFHGLSRSSSHSLSCCAIAGHGEGMQRDYWHDTQRDPGKLMTPEAVGKEAARRIVRRLGAGRPETMTCPVIFDAHVASSMLSHLVGAISGSALYRKSSFLNDTLGTRLFKPFIRIHEQPFCSGRRAARALTKRALRPTLMTLSARVC